ncbi:MAG: cysteine--tRNA ligase [Planctomycetes bacterium]|nr:cysteine--tRNA ligase [Planctomycetota bacterium]NBY03128.1 cysteine--tRNA ligase [Planctomycetota bacterium]
MQIKVYNTLTRQKEDFQTLQPGKVGMYVCGPTVYKPSHVGHMVGPVIFDTIKRYLSYLDYQVNFVVNITDVDDKLIVESKKQNTTVTELAERVTADYLANLKKLQVTGIDHFPRATHYIGEIQSMINGLIEKDYAYASTGDVYFDVSKDEDYGKLCNRDPEQLEAGARIEINERKRNPGDFALWKGAKPGEPMWDSPWGPGRPGWHIECSAMSMKLLGESFDMHGGGLDLQFPHHENELAQSESFTGKTFARYWLHNGLMKTGDKKMSKSEGNEIVVTELLKKHQPETLRYLLLSSHYRSPIEYSEDRLLELRRSLESFYRFFDRVKRISGNTFYQVISKIKHQPAPKGISVFLGDIYKLRDSFLEAFSDDFNSGGALGILHDFLNALNRFADQSKIETPEASPEAKAEFLAAVAVFKEITQILGLFLEPQENATTQGNNQLMDGVMTLLIDIRAEARKAKNFALADQVRKRLAELNITLEDRPGETGWRVGP